MMLFAPYNRDQCVTTEVVGLLLLDLKDKVAS